MNRYSAIKEIVRLANILDANRFYKAANSLTKIAKYVLDEYEEYMTLFDAIIKGWPYRDEYMGNYNFDNLLPCTGGVENSEVVSVNDKTNTITIKCDVRHFDEDLYDECTSHVVVARRIGGDIVVKARGKNHANILKWLETEFSEDLRRRIVFTSPEYFKRRFD